jgi:hypothetical protein
MLWGCKGGRVSKVMSCANQDLKMSRTDGATAIASCSHSEMQPPPDCARGPTLRFFGMCQVLRKGFPFDVLHSLCCLNSSYRVCDTAFPTTCHAEKI